MIPLAGSISPYSTWMVGDQEPAETLTSPVITMRSKFIRPCPRRHCWSHWSSNGNNCSTSADLCKRGSYQLTALLVSRSVICHLMRLETSWASLLFVIGSDGTL